MALWLLRRTIAALAILLAVATLVFFAVHAAPGFPFLPHEGHFNPDLEASLRARFGLDRPLPVQFGHYLAALLRGDLGESFSQQRPVAMAIAAALPNTLLLAAAALAIDFLLGVCLGVVQAARHGTGLDAGIGAASLVVYALPTFWLGLLLLLVFGQWLHWLPVGGVVDPVFYDSWSFGHKLLDRVRHLALPALTLGIVGAAGTARFQRAALLDVLGRDLVRTARAKGLSEARVLFGHALRNALLPIVTLLGLAIPFLLTGSVVVETVFAWPGIGKLAADALAARDYPVVMATTLLACVLVVGGNLLADLLSRAADPRLGEARAP